MSVIREIFFFVIRYFECFFLAFLYFSPRVEICRIWPAPFNPNEIRLLHTVFLLSSGFIITWSYYRIMNHNNKKKTALICLRLTLFLGLYFLFFQRLEYNQAMYTLNDGYRPTNFLISPCCSRGLPYAHSYKSDSITFREMQPNPSLGGATTKRPASLCNSQGRPSMLSHVLTKHGTLVLYVNVQ